MTKAGKVHRKKKQKGQYQQFITILGSVLFITVLVIAYVGYRKVYGPSVSVQEEKNAHLYIRTGSNLNDVIDLLEKQKLISNRKTFLWLAQRAGYGEKIHAGHYVVKNGMSNRALILMLRSGRQTPVKVQFHNLRSCEQLAGTIGLQIEADSNEIVRLLQDERFDAEVGFKRETVLCMFIPNTYEFYWNTNAKDFIKRMCREYKKFWNDERRKKAESIGFTPIETSILASIVDQEAMIGSEEPIIAGVYINRLEKGMYLQADPTIRYALKDFSIKRVLKKHLEVNSPYNTYQHYGLPPGPISIPSIAAIDAVLNYQHHKYLYFCAKDDLSGYHYFSTTLEQHLQYARMYQKALNKLRILD